MSQTNQSRQYVDEEGPPRRRVSSSWKFSPASRKTGEYHPSEYHLIDLATGVSHGGFASLAGARQCAREKDLPAWDIFHGDVRIPR
jgi:hypothetical protein